MVEPDGPGVDLPGYAPAERALELALADVSAMVDNLALLETGAIDGETAAARLADIREHVRGGSADWRGATPEARAEARERQAEAWARIVGRYDAAVAAFDALDAPKPWQVAAELAKPHPLAEFLREPPVLTVTGVFRDSFETSRFDAIDADAPGRRGPWWTTFEEEAWEALVALRPADAGRGYVLLAAFEADGWLEQDEGERYGHLGGYEAEFHVEAVRDVRVLTSDEYDALLAAAMRAGAR